VKNPIVPNTDFPSLLSKGEVCKTQAMLLMPRKKAPTISNKHLCIEIYKDMPAIQKASYKFPRHVLYIIKFTYYILMFNNNNRIRPSSWPRFRIHNSNLCLDMQSTHLHPIIYLYQNQAHLLQLFHHVWVEVKRFPPNQLFYVFLGEGALLKIKIERSRASRFFIDAMQTC